MRVNPVLLQLPFDTLTAFKPVVMIGTIPNIIGAHPAQPYKTFAEDGGGGQEGAGPACLCDRRHRHGRATCSMKQIEQQYGMQLRKRALPRAARRPQLTWVAGHVAADGRLGAGARQVRAGRQGGGALVQLGSKRHPMLPDTPTMDELGMKGLQQRGRGWGYSCRRARPDAIVTRFHDRSGECPERFLDTRTDGVDGVSS